MRRRHLQKLWGEHSQVRSHDPTVLNEWATVTTAWHVLARGGELERLTVGDLQFKRQRRSGRRYAILWIAPLKKRGGAQPKLPQFIYEQTSLEEWEPYRALRRLAEIREGAAASAPLFTARKGARLTTARFRALIKRYARMLGWNPKEAGAHSPRIGGATEYAATGKVSQLLLEAKGRWSSDKQRHRSDLRAHDTPPAPGGLRSHVPSEGARPGGTDSRVRAACLGSACSS